ncbi:beta-barrel fold lipoprotein [Coprobacter fastidiosus]
MDGEDGVVNEPMQWVVTVYKNGKEIEKKSLSFRDGKEIGMDDLNLYYN